MEAHCLGGNPYLRLTGTDVSTDDSVDLAMGNYYFLSIDAVQDDTTTLKIYNDECTLVDTLTVTGGDNAIQYCHIGWYFDGMSEDGIDVDIDDVYIAYTDTTYPIIGCETEEEVSIAAIQLLRNMNILG